MYVYSHNICNITQVLRDSESEEDEAFSDEEVSSPEEPKLLIRQV